MRTGIKILMLLLIGALPLRAANWTNYPVALPQLTNTFLIGTATTNEQVLANALTWWLMTNSAAVTAQGASTLTFNGLKVGASSQFGVDTVGNVTSSGNVSLINGGAISTWVEGGSYAPSSFYAYSDTSYLRPSIEYLRAEGTHSTPLQTQSGDWLGDFNFIPYTTASGFLNAAASIVVRQDGATSGSSIPASIIFYSKYTGSGSATESLRITSTGNVGIGTVSPVSSLDVDGNGTFGGLKTTNGVQYANASIAPTGVTVGVTAPDYWVTNSLNDGTIIYMPAWVNH